MDNHHEIPCAPRGDPISEKELFQKYLDICNRALAANKDRFPYKQIWETSEKILREKTVPVAIYDDQPKAVYHLTLHDNHIDTVDGSEQDVDHFWKMNISYLEKVTSHPEEYIRNPAKIDWDWLRSCAGL